MGVPLAIVPNERPSGSYVLMTGGGDGRVSLARHVVPPGHALLDQGP